MTERELLVEVLASPKRALFGTRRLLAIMLAQSDVLVAGAHQPGPYRSRQMTAANRLARDSTAVAIALGAIAACDYAIALVEV